MQVAVAVGVGIDEAGDQDAPFGVDRFRALGRGQSRGAQLGDAIAADEHIARLRGTHRAIEDAAA